MYFVLCTFLCAFLYCWYLFVVRSEDVLHSGWCDECGLDLSSFHDWLCHECVWPARVQGHTLWVHRRGRGGGVSVTRCMPMHVYVCICVSVCRYVCERVCVSVYASMCICVCVCARARVKECDPSVTYLLIPYSFCADLSSN